jgi:hypothetical protein
MELFEQRSNIYLKCARVFEFEKEEKKKNPKKPCTREHKKQFLENQTDNASRQKQINSCFFFLVDFFNKESRVHTGKARVVYHQAMNSKSFSTR